jgi:hypothetical protein
MKFKVGDRVAVYGHMAHTGRRFVGVVAEKSRQTSEQFRGDDYILVRPGRDKDGGYFCSPKQCRRLVKKERRRVWVGLRRYVLGNGTYHDFLEARSELPTGNTADSKPWIEFVEVKK